MDFFLLVAVLDRGKCCAVQYYFVIYSLTEIHSVAVIP